MEHDSAIREDEIPPFATTWVHPETIMLSRNKSDRKNQEPYNSTQMWNIKLRATNEQA